MFCFLFLLYVLFVQLWLFFNFVFLAFLVKVVALKEKIGHFRTCSETFRTSQYFEFFWKQNLSESPEGPHSEQVRKQLLLWMEYTLMLSSNTYKAIGTFP